MNSLLKICMSVGIAGLLTSCIAANDPYYEGSQYPNDRVYRAPDGGVYYPGDVYRDRNGTVYRDGRVYRGGDVYRDGRVYRQGDRNYPNSNRAHFPPGQAKKIYGGEAKDYAPGQQKKMHYKQYKAKPGKHYKKNK